MVPNQQTPYTPATGGAPMSNQARSQQTAVPQGTPQSQGMPQASPQQQGFAGQAQPQQQPYTPQATPQPQGAPAGGFAPQGQYGVPQGGPAGGFGQQPAMNDPFAAGAPMPQASYIETDANKKALGAVLYWGSLIGLIIGIVTCDRSDPFVRHHLNQAFVLFLATIVCSFLCIILIGFVGLIACLVFQIMATMDAYNGKMEEMPLLGKIHILK